MVTGDGGCRQTSAQFAEDMGAAVDQSAAQSGGVVGNKITSQGLFILGVLQSLQDKGYCADYDGEEVQLKKDNAFHEQYDIVIADGQVRRGSGTYRVTCTPAAFPTPAPPLEPTPGCSLPPSREKACGRDDDGGAFVGALDEGISTLRQQHPEYFNGNRVTNVDAYYNGLVDFMKAQGLCATTDFEEISIKKTNEYSENYDPLLSSRDIRSGRGAYRVRCYPAGF